jgi:hypothetical protein
LASKNLLSGRPAQKSIAANVPNAYSDRKMHEPSKNPDLHVPNVLKPPSTMKYAGIITFVVLFMIFPAAWLIAQSFSADITQTQRLLVLTFAALLLLAPGRIVQLAIRRRMNTGRWSLRPSPSERAANLARLAEQRTPQQARRISTLFWLLDGTTLLLYLIILWKYLKPNHGPLDGIDRFIVGLGMLMIAQLLFSIYRKLTQKPKAAA